MTKLLSDNIRITLYQCSNAAKCLPHKMAGLLVSFLLLCSASKAAEELDNHSKQLTTETYQFTHLSIRQGLLDNEIQDIIQDKAGFIWIATSRGLIRYNGTSYNNFHHSVKDITSLSFNQITSLYEDSQGRLWVGTVRGLNQQQGHVDNFKRFYSEEGSNTSLADEHIVDITEDASGRLWVASKSAIHLYNETNDSFTQYFLYDTNSGQNAEITQLVATDNTFLVASSSGLFKLQDADEQFYRYSTTDGLPAEEYTITAFIERPDASLWLAIQDYGIYQSDANGTSFIALSNVNEQLNSISITSDITSIHQSSITNEIWIGTRTDGLFRFDNDTGHLIKTLQSDTNDFDDFENSEISGMFSDVSGLVWIYTRQAGIFQWSSHTLGIQHFGANSGAKDETLLRSYVWYFHQTDKQQLWIGTQRGLMKFDPLSLEYTSVMMDDRPYEEQPSIYWIESDGNTLWLATNQGLLHYDYQNDNIIGRYLTTGIENSIYAVQLTAETLYVAVDQQGIIVLDRETLEPIEKNISLNGKYADLVRRPVGLKPDLDGSIWIMTRDGLINYEPQKDLIRLDIKAGPNELSGERISAFYQQKDKYWIGTSGNGINRLTVQDFEQGTYDIVQYDDVPEIANLVVNGILHDDFNGSRLWISTHSGLILFNPATSYTRKFKLTEGMQSQEFNEAAHYEDNNGLLYFGGINGFNRINPNEFNRSEYTPPLRITKIEVICEEQSLECVSAEQAFNSNLTCDLDEKLCKPVNQELPYDIQSLSIKFSSLDYTLPENNIYRYRLRTSKSTSWTELDHSNKITLSGLSYGHYLLEIQGSNFIGDWSPSIGQLAFSVARPWYYQNYTFVILFLTIMTSLYYFKESRKLKRLERERIQQAINTNEENFQFALWGSGDELWDWDLLNDKIHRSNPIQQIDFNQEGEHLKMSVVLSKVHAEDLTRVRTEMREIIIGEQPFMESIFRFKSRAEGHLWVMCRARVVARDADDKAIRALGSLKDITLMKATEDKLTLIAQAFENTKEGISVVDANFKPVFSNRAFYDITGLDQVESIQKQYFFSPESENYSLMHQVKIYLKNFGEWEGEIWEKRRSGERFAMSLKIDIVQDVPNSADYFICVFSDITYKKRSEEELIKLANIDSLTGLPNRSLFLDRLSHAIAHARRNKSMFALLFIDLDNFKNINDTLGHTMGDKMLINISKRLRSSVRDVDTVARLGGDEFTVILENIKNTNEVGICANKILSRINEAMEIDGSLLKTTPSIGIGMYPANGQDIETLLKNADLAMYSAKEKGKNNYQFFTEDMTSLAMERINIENKLQHAIDSNQLVLYYQPKVYSVTGELTGFEALIRWIHPEDGMISPGAFIPVAEETGLILSLGDWILEEAISQAKKWSKIAPEQCQIAVNISAKQFMSDRFSDRVVELLEKYDLAPRHIELEITEGTLMDNMHHTIAALNRLRDVGLEISLDDFGTGYSSLSYLKRFPVNQLKIDQSFVRDITTDPSDASIVASIINLAHNLGLNVVAEGCETIEQLKFLRAYHCEQVQGYLFSRPLPADEAEKILHAGKILVD